MKRAARYLIFYAGLFGLWTLLAELKIWPPYLFPTPWGVAEANDRTALLFAAPVLVAKLAAGGVALAFIETILAKMRIFRVPEFLATAFMLGVLALLVHLLLGA